MRWNRILIHPEVWPRIYKLSKSSITQWGGEGGEGGGGGEGEEEGEEGGGGGGGAEIETMSLCAFTNYYKGLFTFGNDSYA